MQPAKPRTAGIVLIACWMAAIGVIGVSAQSTEVLLDRARELAREQRYGEALTVLDQVVTATPDDPIALSARGEVLRKLERFDAARRDYEAVARITPRDVDAWFWIATIDRWSGRDREALASYERVLAISVCSTDALTGRARSRLRLGDSAGAEADLRAALACKPGEDEAAGLLAGMLAERGEDESARRLVGRSFEGPDRDMYLGDVAAARGDWGEAAQRYEAALASRPESAALHRRMGDAQRERGQTEAAIESYRRAARLDPSDTRSLYWVGVLESQTGTAEATLEAWDALLARTPDDAAALIGKARILLREGRRDEALALVERALQISPNDQDGRLLRGEILASYNDPAGARADYRSVAAEAPQNLDAWRALDRVGPPRSFGVDARFERSRVIEGLDEAGLETPTGPIVPSRIEYLTEGVAGDVLVPISESVDAVGEVSVRREAVDNLDTGVPVYDFDVYAAAGGLNHVLSRSWSLAWRVGATWYSPRSAGAIEEDTHFLGSLRASWRADRQRVFSEAVADSFLWRGFAGDTTFRIFSRIRIGADWERSLSPEWFVGAAGSVSDYDDGNTVGAVWAATGWTRGLQTVVFRYRHDPFPARFLTDPGNNLDFISYDALSVEGGTPLGAGFRVSGLLLGGLYGPTPRTIEVDTDVPPDGVPNKVEGPDERNTQWLLRAAVEWSPYWYEPFTAGVEVFVDQYAFDTGDYNNIDTVSWTPFVQLADDIGPRWHYVARYGHSFTDDERDPSYGSDQFYGRLDVRLGSLQRLDGAPRLGVEARFMDNDVDEDLIRCRVFLRFPF